MKIFHFLGVDQDTGLYILADSYGNPTSTPVSPTDATFLINKEPKLYSGFAKTIQIQVFNQISIFQFVKQTGKIDTIIEK